MTFIDTYFKYREKYGWKHLGECFCNIFFTGPYLHENQLRLMNEKDDIKATKMIISNYNDLNKSFDGSIYDETTKT